MQESMPKSYPIRFACLLWSLCLLTPCAAEPNPSNLDGDVQQNEQHAKGWQKVVLGLFAVGALALWERRPRDKLKPQVDQFYREICYDAVESPAENEELMGHVDTFMRALTDPQRQRMAEAEELPLFYLALSHPTQEGRSQLLEQLIAYGKDRDSAHLSKKVFVKIPFKKQLSNSSWIEYGEDVCSSSISLPNLECSQSQANVQRLVIKDGEFKLAHRYQCMPTAANRATCIFEGVRDCSTPQL